MFRRAPDDIGERAFADPFVKGEKMQSTINCLFCNNSHEATTREDQFFIYHCDTYGDMYLSRRAIKELRQNKYELATARKNALACKRLGLTFFATYENGLRME